MSLTSKGRNLNRSMTTSLFSTAIVLIFGSGILSYLLIYSDEYKRTQRVCEQLFLTVKKDVEIAAYISNLDLAQEIVDSLAESHLINGSSITIHAVANQNTAASTVNSKQAFIPSKHQINFPVQSPFGENLTGDITLYINQDYISQITQESALHIVSWQFILLALMSFSSTINMRRLVTRPIKSVADQLHKINIDDDQKVITPKSHENGEIGSLVNDINQMLQIARHSFKNEADSRRQITILEKKFRMIFEKSNAGIILIDSDNGLILANPSSLQLFNISEKEINNSSFNLSDRFHTPQQFLTQVENVRRKGINLSCDLQLNTSINPDSWVRCVLSGIDGIDDIDSGIVEGVFYDISDRARREQYYNYQATHDALTGVLNRLGAEQYLPKLLSLISTEGHTVALCMLDLNEFKPINDLYGHDAGDRALIEIAQRLKHTLRSDDMVARWGGDEFVVALAIEDEDSVKTMGEKLLSVFEQPIEVSASTTCQVGVSIGISLSPKHTDDIEQLIEYADSAMYRVKASGKNGFQLYQQPGV